MSEENIFDGDKEQAPVESSNESLDVNKTGSVDHVQGMSLMVTIFFIVGEMAGAGIVTIPAALKDASWKGIWLIVLCAVVSGYTGSQLGKCWTMLQDQWPVYRTQCRKPYPAIAERAFGVYMKHAVSVCIDLTLFGALIVFIILSSKNLVTILETLFGTSISVCIMQINVALFLLPFTFLGSPKDYWGVTLCAMACTVLAVLLMLIGMAIDRDTIAPAEYGQIEVLPFFLSFATLSFAYGGHAAFPTIQHDMQRPTQFPQAVFFAYIIIVLLYLPVGAVGYGIYGDKVANNIIYNLQQNWCRTATALLITVHVIFTCVIVANPVNLEIEQAWKMPPEFSLERCASRTLTMVVALTCAECFPNFGAILDLIGASTITLLTFVFPGACYLRLKQITNANNQSQTIAVPKWEYAVNGAIIVTGLLSGVLSFYSSVHKLDGSVITKPCFLQ